MFTFVSDDSFRIGLAGSFFFPGESLKKWKVKVASTADIDPNRATLLQVRCVHFSSSDVMGMATSDPHLQAREVT